MALRGNEFDVSSSIDTTSPDLVNAEVDRIYQDLYGDDSTLQIDQAFREANLLYAGALPGYHACDTAYHDIQHVLDVTLAMARLIDGYQRGRIGPEPIGPGLFQLGVITALFHDCGYVRRLDDAVHKNGAELTVNHVSIGSVFLRDYFNRLGMPENAEIASQLIHFTGYETPVNSIRVPSPIHRLLGSLLGSADIIAQMSDRCYLEKCRDRLYPEFVAAGFTVKRLPGGEEQVMFASEPVKNYKNIRTTWSTVRALVR
ncbi:MAG: hypothetical protein EXR27_08940 [Betaproteobacteria bacterium]|nr:hypothetical protein [Betaproteobacteria bacterium]